MLQYSPTGGSSPGLSGVSTDVGAEGTPISIVIVPVGGAGTEGGSGIGGGRGTPAAVGAGGSFAMEPVASDVTDLSAGSFSAYQSRCVPQAPRMVRGR